MELKGERLIPASVDTTWRALNDPAILRDCIAGCESIERTGEDAYEALVAVKVGPVSARFKGKLQMTDVQPPNSYTIHFDGQGGVAGLARARPTWHWPQKASRHACATTRGRRSAARWRRWARG